MVSFRRCLPPIASRPPGHDRCLWLAALAWALTPLMSTAQVRSEAMAAADPATPVAVRPDNAPSAPTLPTSASPADLQEALTQWQRANERVAAFPRGHIDLLKWEARNTAPNQALPAGTQDKPLLPAEALRLAMAQRPGLFAKPGASAPEHTATRMALLAHASEVQRAWIQAIAARASLRHQRARLENAQSGADLGQRMVQAGSWSRARLLREQLIVAREHQARLLMQQAASGAEEQLIRALGQWQGPGIESLLRRLPEQLPEPPAQVEPAPGMSQQNIEAAVLRSSPGLDAQTAHALAQHAHNVILPLQAALEQETLLRYNGMLQSTWELLEASRERMQAASSAAQARRDFWLAQLDWQTLLAGGDYAPGTVSSSMGNTAQNATPGH